jgi:hypothetical protein
MYVSACIDIGICLKSSLSLHEVDTRSYAKPKLYQDQPLVSIPELQMLAPDKATKAK